MACFVAPVTEAVATTIVTKIVSRKESPAPEGTIPLSRKLGWLNKMLWGGSALLAFEHLWHGEVTPWFPFLTAAANPEDAAVMFHEIATVGVSMSLVVTGVWAAMVLVSNALVRRKARHGEETL